MKKIALGLLIALALASALNAQNYTVQSVSGRVQREAGSRKIDVAAGDVLSADTLIHTGIGASLVLREGEKTFSIPAAQNGKMVRDLVTAGAGVRISGNVTRINTGAAARTTAQVSTASARASDAAADDDIAAE